MKLIRKMPLVFALAAVALVVALVVANRDSRPAESPAEAASNRVDPGKPLPIADAAGQGVRKNGARPGLAENESGTDMAADEEDPQTEAEKREAEEEKLVEAFDDLTDKWMEPSEKGVTMKDVADFVAQFKKVPKDRREECLQRALNLVPDENVMLLAGVLMDKDQPKELVELVFNDILNRDEDVKKPILQQVYKDKKHPCWADAAWIFDVTGEQTH